MDVFINNLPHLIRKTRKIDVRFSIRVTSIVGENKSRESPYRGYSIEICHIRIEILFIVISILRLNIRVVFIQNTNPNINIIILNTC